MLKFSHTHRPTPKGAQCRGAQKNTQRFFFLDKNWIDMIYRQSARFALLLRCLTTEVILRQHRISIANYNCQMSPKNVSWQLGIPLSCINFGSSVAFCSGLPQSQVFGDFPVNLYFLEKIVWPLGHQRFKSGPAFRQDYVKNLWCFRNTDVLQKYSLKSKYSIHRIQSTLRSNNFFLKIQQRAESWFQCQFCVMNDSILFFFFYQLIYSLHTNLAYYSILQTFTYYLRHRPFALTTALQNCNLDCKLAILLIIQIMISITKFQQKIVSKDCRFCSRELGS